jgi:serine/threonine-protein kinase HipA
LSREIHVFGDWVELGKAMPIGTLRSDLVRGEEVFSFEYDLAWLGSRHAIPLDPALQLYSGRQYQPQQSASNFGLFLDSCPDRWGRVLMTRREAIDARREDRAAKRLSESDFLLGVHDEQRMGALRFKLANDGPFLSDDEGMATPPWVRLRELENAAWQIQSIEMQDDLQLREWLGLLLAPGSSIGGARPKAGVSDEDGALWIAKFPGRADHHDVGAWEMVVHQLAVQAGLDVSSANLEQFGQRHRTFLSKRFDRNVIEGMRIRRHFASAMTMLGHIDGTDSRDGASYLEIVEFLCQHGADVDLDLEELWRRIVFSICVSNTDDHLRNHGFLLEPGGWKLSPAYDLNPSPEGVGLSLNISETDNSLSLDLALNVSEYFRIGQQRSRQILNSVQAAVSDWKALADQFEIPRAEQEAMRRAFRHAE